MKPERILYFSRDYTTHDWRFLKALVTHGYEIHYLRLEDDGHTYELRPLPEGIRPVPWCGGQKPAPNPADWEALIPEFIKIVETIRPDLIHAGPVPSCGFISASAQFHPLLLMSWGSDLLVDAETNPTLQTMARHALANADALVCDATAVRQKAVERYGFSEDRIIQFPWGIDLQHFAPGPTNNPIRCQWGWENNHVLLSTRAWEPSHGVDTLLEAFRLASEKDPELRLIMLSDGSAQKRVQTFFKEHDLTSRVCCPGQVAYQSLPMYYQAADFYLSCAPSDGVSISLLEALATGLPVVVTDIPGNREWVMPNVNGWLFPKDDPDRCCDALLQATQINETTRQIFCTKNRQLAETHADWNQNVRQLTNTYDRLIRKRPLRSTLSDESEATSL